MPSTGAEIGNPQPLDLSQALDLFPQLGHGARIKHLELEPAHIVQHCTATQFHQHGQRGDFPHHHLGP